MSKGEVEMKKIIVVCVSIAVGVFAVRGFCSEQTEDAPADTPSAKDPNAHEKLQKFYEKNFGGYVIKPGSRQGSIRFVNAQKRLEINEIEKVIGTIRSQLKCDIGAIEKPQSGLPTREMVASVGATLAIFVVDNPSLPTSLVAQEDRWAMVNIAKLSDGLKEDVVGKRLFARRARGMLMRVFSLLCGGGSSQYKGNLFGVPDARSLDSVDVDSMIVDMVSRYVPYLETVGVTPEYRATYSRACMEGWAPAPTNEYQKAVAERIKEKQSKGPTKGMTIEYDPKTGR